MSRLTVAAAAAALLVSGCATIEYYLQSAGGQMQILQARQSIATMVANPSTPPALREKLVRVLEIRDFASRELKLPDNLSYRAYADVRRPFVVWNVFATGEFSIEPRQWCFPVAGCVVYRGYFSQEEAAKFAQQQRSSGLDVFVGGVPAYSTLGWFDDPVLNTVINYPEFELARLIFHELAHQVAYAKNDSEFNESFAVAVELEGVRRWLSARNDDAMRKGFELSQQRREQFIALVLQYRGELGVLYRSGLPAAAMRERKAAVFAALLRDYRQLRESWGGFAGYDRFFENPNNANLASVAVYHARVPQFQALLARRSGDLAAFYGDVRKLADSSTQERARILSEVR